MINLRFKEVYDFPDGMRSSERTRMGNIHLCWIKLRYMLGFQRRWEAIVVGEFIRSSIPAKQYRDYPFLGS
jgi:hypothetical protein